jgi:hypothetical protein
MNAHRLAPSWTLLLNAAVIATAAFVCTASHTDADFAPARANGGEIALQRAASFTLAPGQASVLPAGSRWRAVGSVAQGTVYRPLNTVLLREGRHAAEAYAVVQGGRLLGLFVPGEKSFSPALRSVALAI